MQTQNRNKKIACLLTSIAFAVSHVFVVTAYAEEAKLAPVEVIATTPLAGIGVPKEQIAANVQTATGQQIEDSGALNIADYMNKNMTGVHVNDNQGNPFQVDLNYRGFTASPLLGTPQGISVYMDGVRMNQPFGDIVQWDLIPKSAIKNMTLIPGSNPLFGLNTLGGAISIQTKDGLSYQGTEVEAGVGSYGRYSTEFETGGKNDNGLNWYVNATRWGEDGWRDSSPSGITQLFSKLGWKSRDTDLKLTYALANSNLTGNGLQQKELLDSNYKSVFTKPDQTHNNANFLNLEGKHSINESTIFTGNAYYRKTNTRTFNGDLNEDSLGASVFSNTYDPQSYNGVNSLTSSYYRNGLFPGVTSYSALLPNGYGGKCQNEANSNGEPNEKCTGILTSTATNQNNFGLSGQLSFDSKILNMAKNNLIVGGGVDFSRSRYTQSSQFGYLNTDRSITPIYYAATYTAANGAVVTNGSPVLANGIQQSENAFDNTVDLSGKSRTTSIFAFDTISSQNDVYHLSLGARFNTTALKNTDNYFSTYESVVQPAMQSYMNSRCAAGTLLGSANGVNYYRSGSSYFNSDCVDWRNGDLPNPRNSLAGTHTYSRLNPLTGLSFTPSKNFSAYASYSESNRAPTSIELGCADPDFGCRLPNSMAGDPDLKQVVAKTTEIGARGFIPENKIAWSVAVYNTNLQDDILFVANSASTGYFKNFGQTRRRGAEFGLAGKEGKFSYAFNYAYLEATFQSDATIGSPYNSSADSNGNIQVKKGNTIPLMPESNLKLRLGYDVNTQFKVGLGATAVSSSYARGNENNLQAVGVSNAAKTSDSTTKVTTNISNASLAGGGAGTITCDATTPCYTAGSSVTSQAIQSNGDGKVPAYMVFDLSAQYRVDSQLAFNASIMNLFDRKYYTSGQLGPYAFDSNGGWNSGGCTASNDGACKSTMMYSPGAPRTFWVSMRYTFDKPRKD